MLDYVIKDEVEVFVESEENNNLIIYVDIEVWFERYQVSNHLVLVEKTIEIKQVLLTEIMDVEDG